MRVVHILSSANGVLRGTRLFVKNMGRLKIGIWTEFRKYSVVRVKEKGKIKMGNGCFVGKYSTIVSVGGNLSVGEHTYFNKGADIICRESIRIGNNCAFGPRVTIYDHDHKFGKNGKEPGFNLSEIIIEDNCWVGANVTILRGTHIGKNCVIGAGCVVKGQIPDNTLVTQSRELVFKPLV